MFNLDQPPTKKSTRQTTREIGFHECSAKFLYQVPLKLKTNYYAFFFFQKRVVLAVHMIGICNTNISSIFILMTQLKTNKCPASLKTATP
jgi:hypothetical protein